MLRRFRSFQRGIVGLCKSTGSKVTSCPSWRMILYSGNQNHAKVVQLGPGAECLVNPPNLTPCNCGASGPKDAQSTSLERSQPSKYTKFQFRGLAGFYYRFCPFQATSFTYGLFTRGMAFISCNCILRKCHNCVPHDRIQKVKQD